MYLIKKILQRFDDIINFKKNIKMGLFDFLKSKYPEEIKSLNTLNIIKYLMFIIVNLTVFISYSQEYDFTDLNEKTVNEFLTKKEGFELIEPYEINGYKIYSSKNENSISSFESIRKSEIYFKNQYPLLYISSLYQRFNKNDELVKELKYEFVESLFADEIKFIKERNIQFEKLTDSEYVTKKYTINDIYYVEKGKIAEKDDYYDFKRERHEMLTVDKYPMLKWASVDDGLKIFLTSTYNIEAMINLFINDLKYHINDFKNNNIETADSKKISDLIIILDKIQVKATFEEMDNETLAVSYGINNDKNILVKVNPVKWAEASNQKKWYIIYHELGHDVLNFHHGEGDKMMFNFIDKKYSWGEFFDDRKKMFDIYFSKKLVKTNLNIKGQVSSINNSIPSFKIGTQTWTTINLNISKYRNGDVIPEVKDINEWANLTTGAWCYYNNDPKNATVYGKLYNWYAVNDSRGLAPLGYHIASKDEWNKLITFLGGENIAGEKMKKPGTLYWNDPFLYNPNNKATNSSSFTGLPGGNRYSVEYDNDGGFGGLGMGGAWWSSSILNNDKAWYHFMTINHNSTINTNKAFGLSVRCIKD